MKSFYIKDGLQIIAALLLTTSMVYAMETPTTNKQAQISPSDTVQTVEAEIVASEPETAPVAVPEQPQAIPEPVNDPNKCEPAKYWSKEPPYNCIDKPVAAPVAGSPEVIRSAQKFSGDKNSWLIASGIPESEWWAVDYIVSRESGWNPCAYNPGRSDCNAMPTSACGLAQSYPCGKVPGHWTDPVANLKWQYQYVKDRYGGYPQAVTYWQKYHSY